MSQAGYRFRLHVRVKPQTRIVTCPSSLLVLSVYITDVGLPATPLSKHVYKECRLDLRKAISQYMFEPMPPAIKLDRPGDISHDVPRHDWKSRLNISKPV